MRLDIFFGSNSGVTQSGRILSFAVIAILMPVIPGLLVISSGAVRSVLSALVFHDASSFLARSQSQFETDHVDNNESSERHSINNYRSSFIFGAHRIRKPKRAPMFLQTCP
jgi:hypothetical protein